MTELMKRYEAETGCAGIAIWRGECTVSNKYIEWLEAQLTWRPVSEEPEKGVWVTLRKILDGKLDDELVWFYHLEDVADWENLVATLDATHWLPIPPMKEGM